MCIISFVFCLLTRKERVLSISTTARRVENRGIRSQGIAIAAHVLSVSVGGEEIKEIIRDLLHLRHQTPRELTLAQIVEEQPWLLFHVGLKSPSNLILAVWGWELTSFFLTPPQTEGEDHHRRMVVMCYFHLLVHRGIDQRSINKVRRLNGHVLSASPSSRLADSDLPAVWLNHSTGNITPAVVVS